ncbi:MAG: 7-carboxy-7-deazaguanine synthase, partial [Muribaculaceae bacterium]|nr:7-carboxy-7-deazaguanine synthase [Muribaculaceae bacterium]
CKVDELKVVYEGQDVESIAKLFEPTEMSLQPCSGKNVAETVNYVKAHPHWRLSLQLHKLIGIE